METFREAILPGLAQINLSCIYAPAMAQAAQRQRDELRPIIHPESGWHASFQEQRFQRLADALRNKAGSYLIDSNSI